MSNSASKQGQFASLNEPKESKRPGVPVMWIGLAVVAVIALAAAVAIGISSGDDSDTVETADGEVVDPIEMAEVIVDGDPLPELTNPADDVGIGVPAPELSGLSYTGEPTEILFDGRPKVVVFLAHWCPHCQRELPLLVDWLEAEGLRDDVDLYAVATNVDRSAPNYPPSAWFEEEGLDVPILMDSENNDAARAFGLNAFPYWVALDADGTVALRLSGELPDVLGRPAEEAFAFMADFAAADAE
ncbi:MAG: TlpA disulfide reductase family protein [Actinomycetota bacterium]